MTTENPYQVSLTVSNDFDPMELCTMFANIVNESATDNWGSAPSFLSKKGDGCMQLIAVFDDKAGAKSSYKKLESWASRNRRDKVSAHVKCEERKPATA